LVLSLAAACSPDSGGEATPMTVVVTTAAPTTQAVTTTTSKWTPEQQAVVDTYLAWDKAFHNAAQQEKPDFTEMARYGGGDLLTKNKLLLSTSARDGVLERPGTRRLAQTKPVRIAEQDGKIFLELCSVNDWTLYRVADGSVVDDDVVTNLVAVQIELVNDQLKVTGGETPKKWPGEAMATCLQA
jgi:hypothetical protein